jgi:2-succinyl-5-enolpyruvyl-6-hydroxy-3-cyclohexene-1-carboxylate synthase
VTAPRNRNELWGRVLVEELVRAGVRQVVVSPGSRSTPLVLAAAGHSELQMVVEVDERAGAFCALGVGKASGRPAAVITTSGTAAANLLPAVVEAAQSETPLILLTADRPTRLRGADANQAIDQQHLFGRYPRFYQEVVPAPLSEGTLRHLRSVACRAVAAAVGDPGGPSHLNLPFDKPLEPTPVPGDIPPELEDEATLARTGRGARTPFTRIHPRRAAPLPVSLESLSESLRRARRPLMVAGPTPRPWEAGPVLRAFAEEAGLPLLADPLSGARYGGGGTDTGAPELGGYDLVLGDPWIRDALAPDFVVRVGAGPTSANLSSWLGSLAEVPQVLVDGGGRWKDHQAAVSEMIPADPGLLFDSLGQAAVGSPDPEWNRVWRTVAVTLRAGLERLGRAPPFEGMVAVRLVESLSPGELLFASSSMPIRDVDAFGVLRQGDLHVLGNRGASGIDGIVSTAAGASLATGRRVTCLVGDLALLHDSTGLSLLQESGIRVVLVVLNNDGGGIFHRLPIREREPTFTRFFATPHGRDLVHLARLWDLPHHVVDLRDPPSGSAVGGSGLESLDHALAWAGDLEGSGIVEIRTDRDENRLRRAAAEEGIQQEVRRALERLGLRARRRM